MLKNTTKIVASQNGMSLIEILIALTLLGLAGTFVAGKVTERLQEGQVQTAKIQIRSLSERLKEFRRDCNFIPTTDQGLDALVEKPTGGRECKRYAPGGYIEGGKVPLDPWDGEYIYESDGKTFTIISLGADNAEGGEGADADINSKDL
ncbi:type II secretion system major pseudopilin GspG [Peredibacter starrii]|uniref:Type II secretion system core protein G n=1 Tax=Peredibacter starrii TaxID=28202 RepID=A0AAX4HL25_9BACT|nr:type II secretion system major pseudopilin GspG [Peredibacter starrii]WPU64012.1 type II secretion system major pseudopilin GspG [Peredibacter starrii]